MTGYIRCVQVYRVQPTSWFSVSRPRMVRPASPVFRESQIRPDVDTDLPQNQVDRREVATRWSCKIGVFPILTSASSCSPSIQSCDRKIIMNTELVMHFLLRKLILPSECGLPRNVIFFMTKIFCGRQSSRVLEQASPCQFKGIVEYLTRRESVSKCSTFSLSSSHHHLERESFTKKSDQDHLSSVDPVYACVVGNQKVGDQVPVGRVVVHLFNISIFWVGNFVVHPEEAGLLHVGYERHPVLDTIKRELLQVEISLKCKILQQLRQWDNENSHH